MVVRIIIKIQVGFLLTLISKAKLYIIDNNQITNIPDYQHSTVTYRPRPTPTYTTKKTTTYRPTTHRPNTYPSRPSSTPNPTGAWIWFKKSSMTWFSSSIYFVTGGPGEGNLGVQPPSTRPTTPNPNAFQPANQPIIHIRASFRIGRATTLPPVTIRGSSPDSGKAIVNDARSPVKDVATTTLIQGEYVTPGNGATRQRRRTRRARRRV